MPFLFYVAFVLLLFNLTLLRRGLDASRFDHVLNGKSELYALLFVVVAILSINGLLLISTITQ